VSALEAGAGVVTSRGDVHYVVTEYGIAQLWGKTIRERAAALVEVAHPDFRADLLNEAKARHFLLPDHPPPNPQSKSPERQARLASGELVQIRPLRVSDEDKLQDLLYELSDESTFMRFFGQVRTHPHQEVLRLVEQDGTTSLAFVACLAETDELLAVARCDLDPRTGAAELGLTVADAWQSKGLGGMLLERLMAAAAASGIRALIAEVLPSNGRMQRVLRRAEFHCSGEPGPDPLMFRRSLLQDARDT
jgi:RimJ/RimL family protein N-acetyltransferase